MKRWIVLTITLLILSTSFAQTPVSTDLADRFEYLVVSFGKTQFTSPFEAKMTGKSKVLIYSAAGLQFADEAVSTQRQMDLLGRFGWDLNTVVGSIGGDQEMIFKRPYDPKRSAKEAKQIADEAKLLAAHANEVKPAEAVPQPVDLDAVEAAKTLAEADDKRKQLLSNAVTKSITGYVVVGQPDLTAGQSYIDPSKRQVRIAITIDGTAKLLKGNTYRASEAKSYAEEIASAIYGAANLNDHILEGTNAFIDVDVIVKLSGKDWPVGNSHKFASMPD